MQTEMKLLGLDEALSKSLKEKAQAVTDVSEDIFAERRGNRIIIFHHKYTKQGSEWKHTSLKYHSYNRIEEVDSGFLECGWFAN